MIYNLKWMTLSNVVDTFLDNCLVRPKSPSFFKQNLLSPPSSPPAARVPLL